jgi:phage shock protein PspC (stress-responsive transcriptional regulator)
MDGREPVSRWLRGYERPREGRLLAGVCAGLAGPLKMDVTLLRLAFLLLALASGLGLLLYLALWILLPEEGAGAGRAWRGTVWANLRGIRHDLYEALRKLSAIWSRRGASTWPRPLGRRWLAVGLIVGGALVLLHSLGLFAWLGTTRALGLAAIVVGAAVLVNLAPGLKR